MALRKDAPNSLGFIFGKAWYRFRDVYVVGIYDVGVMGVMRVIFKIMILIGVTAFIGLKHVNAQVPNTAAEIEKYCNLQNNDFIKCVSYGDQANGVTQYTIGKWYELGIATAETDSFGKVIKIGKPDIEKAIYWYAKAANNGDAGSAYRLGEIYYYGIDVLINYKEAAKWYRKSVEGGTPFAALTLSDMYNLGRGVEKNNIKSLMWMHITLFLYKKITLISMK